MYQAVVGGLLIVAAVAFVIGVFRPAFVLPARMSSRGNAAVLYGAAVIALGILLAMARREGELALPQAEESDPAAEQPPLTDVHPDIEPGITPEAAQPQAAPP